MKIKIYEICNTNTEDHLNGQIIITNRSPKTCFATIMVYDKLNKNECDTFHISSEKICLKEFETETSKPKELWWYAKHETSDGILQEWKFSLEQSFAERNEGWDNGSIYTSSKYIKYKLKTNGIQGDGTGTAGNTGGN